VIKGPFPDISRGKWMAQCLPDRKQRLQVQGSQWCCPRKFH